MEMKDAVRARDGYRCTRCGMTNEEHKAACGRQLEVHRLVPGAEYTLEGCTTLCQRCHDAIPMAAYERVWVNYDGSVRIIRTDPQAKPETRALRARRVARWSRFALFRHTGIPCHRLRQWEEGKATLNEVEAAMVAGAFGIPVHELPISGDQLPHERVLAEFSDWAFDV